MSVYHNTSQNLLTTHDPVDILLVGCGGTGSEVLGGLAKINKVILELGHDNGLRVIVVDPDTISEPNTFRQPFSSCDIGESKARILVQRINRRFGLNWQAIPDYINEDIFDNLERNTFVISTIDTVEGRRDLHDLIKKYPNKCEYWMDFGNSARTGQVVLSTPRPINQDDDGCGYLPNIFDFFPNMEDSEDANEPSCSAREALESQDLFINQRLATDGLDLVWQMFRFGRIADHGFFVNLEDYRASVPITVESSQKRFQYQG